MKLSLIGFELCPYAQRVAIVMNECGIEYERIYIDLANKPNWFLDKSPLGKVPILETSEGVLFESNVICEYVNDMSRAHLHPENDFQRARNKSWIEYGSSILSLISQLYNSKDKQPFNKVLTEIRKRMQFLENEVHGQFLNGDKFMIVDAVYATVFRYFNVIETRNNLDLLGQSSKIEDWRNNIFKRVSVKNAVVKDFDEKLLEFYLNRESYISSILKEI